MSKTVSIACVRDVWPFITSHFAASAWTHPPLADVIAVYTSAATKARAHLILVLEQCVFPSRYADFCYFVNYTTLPELASVTADNTAYNQVCDVLLLPEGRVL